MKKTILILLLAFLGFNSFSQVIEDCDSVSFSTTEECSAAEPCIENLSTFILAKPVTSDDIRLTSAFQILTIWMINTHYTFTIDAAPLNIAKGKNENLLRVYMACLAIAGLEKGKNGAEPEALKMYVAYIKNPKNKVKMTGKVKKFLAEN